MTVGICGNLPPGIFKGRFRAIADGCPMPDTGREVDINLEACGRQLWASLPGGPTLLGFEVAALQEVRFEPMASFGRTP